MINKRQHFIWSSIMLVFAFATGGCLKTNSSSNTTKVCYVSVMNEAPYSSAADIYFNGTQVSTAGGIEPGQFSSEYASVRPGSYTVDFKVVGTDSVLYEIPATTYDTSAFYTLILYNTAPKSPAVAAARIVDDYSAVTQTTSAYYRFFNLSPDASAVDLHLNSTVAQSNRLPVDNLANLSYNAFQPITPGTYTVNVNKANTDTVLATLATPAELIPGTVYTMFLFGTSSTLTVSAVAETY